MNAVWVSMLVLPNYLIWGISANFEAIRRMKAGSEASGPEAMAYFGIVMANLSLSAQLGM